MKCFIDGYLVYLDQFMNDFIGKASVLNSANAVIDNLIDISRETANRRGQGIQIDFKSVIGNF